MKKILITVLIVLVVVPILAAAAVGVGLYYLIGSIPQWLLVAVIVYLLTVIARMKKRAAHDAESRRAAEAMMAEIRRREALAAQQHAMRQALAESQGQLMHRVVAPRPISAPQPWKLGGVG